MRKKLSSFALKYKWLLLLAFIFGVVETTVANTPVSIGSSFAIVDKEIYYFKADQKGYVLVEFATPMDMMTPNGVFYTYVPQWNDADYVLDAVASNGVAQGKATITMYDGIQQYEQYTNVTKLVYAIDAGNNYCIWNRSGSSNQCTLTFSATVPDLSSGGGGTGGDSGELIGSYNMDQNALEYFTAPADGYFLIEAKTAFSMESPNGFFYTGGNYSWGKDADEVQSAIECNGTEAGTGTPQYGYGSSYPAYTNVTQIVYAVKGNQLYCIWNRSAANEYTVTFYTEKPSLSGGGGGGSDTPEPSKNVIYICDDSQYPDPSNPLVVEVGSDGNYSFTLNEASMARFSTTKSQTPYNWSGFEEGEFNMYVPEDSPKDRTFSKTTMENMKAKSSVYIATEPGQHGWLYFPWRGDYVGVYNPTGGVFKTGGINIYTDTPEPKVEVNYPVYDPAPGELEDGFSTASIVWAPGQVVAINESAIYITNPKPNGPNITGNDLEIIFFKNDGSGGGFAEGDSDSKEQYILSIGLDPGSSYADPVTGLLINPLPTPATISVVVPASAITIDEEKAEQDITLTYTIPAGDVDIDIPDPVIFVPQPESMAADGFQWRWGDYLTVEWINESATHEATMKLPSGETYTYKIRLNDNVPAEEPGYNGSAKRTDGVDNSCSLASFRYSADGVSRSWAKEGTYTVTVPAGIINITLEDGTKVPNPETVMTFTLAGRHILDYAVVKAPQFGNHVTEWTEDNNLGDVESLDEVIITYGTYTQNDIPVALLSNGTVNVQVSYNGGAAQTVAATVMEHWSDQTGVGGKNYNDPGLKLDLSTIATKPGQYVVTVPANQVYTGETLFQNACYNQEQSFTFNLIAATPKTDINFQFELPEELGINMSDKPFLIYQSVSSDGVYSNVAFPATSKYTYTIEGELPQQVFVAFRSKENKITGYTVEITNNEGVPASDYAYTVGEGDFAGNGTVEATVNFNGEIEGKTFIVSVVEPKAEPLNVIEGAANLIYSQTVNGETIDYPYTINYTITYNADKTVSVEADYVWGTNGQPAGLSGNMNIYYPDSDTTVENGKSTTATFEEGEEVEIQTWMACDGGKVTTTINYVVGTSVEVEVPDRELPNVLYIIGEKIQGSSLQPGANDPTLTYNAATGCYEGVILNWPRAVTSSALDKNYNDNLKLFYSKENNLVTWYGYNGGGRKFISVNDGNTAWTYEMKSDPESNRVSGWGFSSSANQATYDMSVSVNLEDMKVTFSLYEEDDTPVDFNDFTVTPDNLDEAPGINEFWGMTFTWNYPVELVDPSKVYVEEPFGYTLTGTNGLNVSVGDDGKSIIIDVKNGPLTGNGTQLFKNAGILNGGIKVNGQLLETEDGGIATEIWWAGGGLEIPDPTTDPAKGLNHQVQTIDKITLNWDGFWVGYSDVLGDWSAVQERVKIYEMEESEWDVTNGTAIDVTLTPEGAANPIGSRWYEKLIVTPAKVLDDPTVKYILVIPSKSLGFKNMDDDSKLEDDYAEPIELVYSVAGEGAMTVFPANYQTVEYDDFNGLMLKNAQGVTVADASKVKLYAGYLGSKSEIETSTPIATGVDNSSEAGMGNILISFPDSDLFNSTYTIIVEDGALRGVKDWKLLEMDGIKDYHGVRFILTGRAMDINTIGVNANPEDDSRLEKIDKVQIWWGNKYKLITSGETVNPNEPEAPGLPYPVVGKMTFNGTTTDVTFEVVMENQPEEGTDDGLGGGVEGAYYYMLQYTPQTPLTEAGEYTFTIPAESVKVYVNQQNQLPNNEVNVTYIVEGQEPKPVYLAAPEYVPSNGAIGIYAGKYDYVWPGGTLKLAPGFNQLDRSKLHVTLNGEEITGATFIAMVLSESNEQNGGNTLFDTDVVRVTPVIEPAQKGTLTITIDEGAVTGVNGEINPQIIGTYYLMKEASDITWEPSKDADDPDSYITFEPGQAVIYASWSEGDVTELGTPVTPSFYQVLTDGVPSGQIPATQYMTVEDGKLKIDFSSLEEGIYNFCLSEGSVIIGDYTNIEAFYNFRIEVPAVIELPEPEVRVLPYGDTFTYWDAFSVTWFEKEEVPYELEIVDASKITIVDSQDEELGFTASLTEYDPREEEVYNDSQLVLTLDMLCFENGTYTLTIPAGAVNVIVDGVAVPNQEVTYTFTFQLTTPPVELPEPTVTPAEERVAALEKVTLSWDGFEVMRRVEGLGEYVSEITVAHNGGEAQVVKTSYEGEESEAFMGYYPTLVLEINGYENGEYVITIPADCLQLANEESGTLYLDEDIVLTFTVDSSLGIAYIVGSQEGRWVVYNMNGVMLLNTDNREDLKLLEPGFYVINGKKVILK